MNLWLLSVGLWIFTASVWGWIAVFRGDWVDWVVVAASLLALGVNSWAYFTEVAP